MSNSEVQIALSQAQQVMLEADAVVILAGAGMGVDSGLPDFRGKEGFWRAYPPLAKFGYSFSDMANPIWFKRDPKLAWAFYGHRLNLYRETKPHPGFYQLLSFVQKKKHGYFVFTSNVDGQFQKAGFNPENIVECHGSIHHLQCTKHCGQMIWSAEETQVEVDMVSFKAQLPLPICLHCGALARPNILMFGDCYWLSDRTDMQIEKWQHYLNTLRQQKVKTAIVEMGAGENVATVRHQSEYVAHLLKMSLIRINPRDYQVPKKSDITLPLGALAAIEQIVPVSF
ncbi:SIR2 family NAD-dependent protein deacylase [Thioflexithrix psekupsensis]|uniref:protein acetyllysine N-acetyltransferase n=1 Tax=Thioflexithrix psekupsensis TaxID=1570016 RepID=A0A251XCF5_9GAMM|nr:Sir2 family NAD-dependent protein deacetylase [Thioflexithrix psekupsensis]OUD15770.1 NAD-dependent deacetylase [Thioflexithrix psekupsensis]